MKKKLLCFFLLGLGLAITGVADEKIVWSPKDNIGKTTTWKNNDKASANAGDGFYEIVLSGSEWSGMGLNWEGYWPADAGEKAADYRNLILELKISGANANDLQVALKDNKSKDSVSVFLKKYFPNGTITNEKIVIKIPMSDLLTEKSKFETGIVWEIMFHSWTQDSKEVKIEVYKIAFEK